MRCLPALPNTHIRVIIATERGGSFAADHGRREKKNTYDTYNRTRSEIGRLAQRERTTQERKQTTANLCSSTPAPRPSSTPAPPRDRQAAKPPHKSSLAARCLTSTLAGVQNICHCSDTLGILQRTHAHIIYNTLGGGYRRDHRPGQPQNLFRSDEPHVLVKPEQPSAAVVLHHD